MHVEVQKPDDMGMFQVSDDLGFLLEETDVVSHQMGMQDFNGGLPAESDMLSQVHICEAALPDPSCQAIVSEEISNVISHP